MNKTVLGKRQRQLARPPALARRGRRWLASMAGAFAHRGVVRGRPRPERRGVEQRGAVERPDRHRGLAVPFRRLLCRRPSVRPWVPACGRRTRTPTAAYLGHKVSLDIISDASDPTQVATNYQTLINVKHVNLIFGPFSTLLTVPAAKVTNRYGYAMIEGAGGGPLAFATGLHSLFDVSAPVANSLVPFANWIASLPKSERPKTAAYPTSNDPFTEPQLPVAEHILQKAGVKTVYFKVFPAEVTDYTPIADAVAASNAQIVLLGSVDVPTVSAFIHAFAQQHYNPEAFVATAGPDQGAAFVSAVGRGQH